MSLSRRDFLKVVGAGSVALLTSDLSLHKKSFGQEGPFDLEVYKEADIDWRQFEGEELPILVTPAHYFDKFRAVTDSFTELTGIDVNFEIIPPREMREKAVLDFASGTKQYASHTADPMYLPLYAANDWIDPIGKYHQNSNLTDQEWFDMDDIIPLWRKADSVNGQLYAMPVEGEVTIHLYRKDLYDELGLTPPETLEELKETAKELDKLENMAGLALRGFRGAGQNMYVWPSLFIEFGGEWFDDTGAPAVNSEAGLEALKYYVEVLNEYGPSGVRNWNWPEIMEAFASGSVAQFVDANSTASTIEDPEKSEVAGKVGYQRWPKGPTGKRCTSIWNWAMPINKQMPEKTKKATWLYLEWLNSRPTQFRSATFKKTEESLVRTGVNRLSIWEDPEYEEKAVGFAPEYTDVVLTSLEEDTNADWRPRVPEWPQIGETMAIAIQAALVGQKSPKKALDDANQKIKQILS